MLSKIVWVLKKTVWLLGAASLLFYFGNLVFVYVTGPLRDAPELQEGEFLLAYRNGFKGVMSGIGERDETRKYLHFDAVDVPEWYKESWSRCRRADVGEMSAFKAAADIGPGGRIEAVCEIDADGDVFVRGWVVSVPDV